jgi:hydrogenase maturation protein HypF
LKNTVAVVRGGDAILSHHIGDLTHAKAYASFRKAIADMCELFAIRPQWIAHDLHPMYLSTVYAKQLAAEMGVPLIGIQQHHAPPGSRKRRDKEPVIAPCLDTGHRP